MMIDFIKFSANVKLKELEENPKLDIKGMHNHSTGEILPNKWAEYGAIRIKSTQNNKCLCDGSIHKHYKGKNWDRFTLSEIRCAIDNLIADLGINSSEINLQCLEIEFNLHLPFSPQRILNSIVSSGGSKNVSFQQINRRRKADGKICQRDKYAIKLYDKGRTEKLEYNLLRVGVRLEGFKAKILGVTTIHKLKDKNVLNSLFSFVYKSMESIIFIDPKADTSKLTTNQQLRYNLMSCAEYWGKLNFSQRKNAKQTLARIENRVKHTDYKSILLEKLEDEFSIIMEEKQTHKSSYVLPSFEPEENKS